MHIETTESVSLCARMKKLTAFLELESVIKTGRYNRCLKEKS
jgi:hypothetical protein